MPASPTASYRLPPLIPDHAPDFVKRVTAVMLANQGDRLPVSAFPGGRHVADRHVAVGEAERRDRDPGVGSAAVHPVQQVRDGLPARGDPRQGLRPGAHDGCAGDVQGHALQGAGLRRPLHRAGGAGGLHRLRAVRDGVPGQGQGQPAAQGDRHGGAGAAARGRARELRVLPRAPRGGSERRSAPTSRARSSSSRSSNTPARAPAAARRRTSS